MSTANNIIIYILCLECGTQYTWVHTFGKKSKCDGCGTENDYWFEHELPPINHR